MLNMLDNESNDNTFDPPDNNSEKDISDIVPVLTSSDLDITEEEVVQQIINAPTKEALEQQFELFNITQSKKNAIRVSKLNKLLDMIEDQAIDRFMKRPDQVSNKEILEYMSVVSSQIERAKNDVNNDLSYKPAIQVTQNKTEVNVNVGDQLDRASKEKVMDVIANLLKQAQAQNQTDIEINQTRPEQNYIDITEEIEEKENFSFSSGDVLYTEDDNE